MRVWWRQPWLVVGSGLMLCLLVGSGAAQRQQTDVRNTLAMGEVNWTMGVVQSRGQAYPGRGDRRTSQQHSTTYGQATQTARQRLFETIVHLRYDATQTVAEVLRTAADRRQRLQALVAEAEVIHTRYGERGAVESTVQLSLFGPLTTLLLPESVGLLPDMAPMADRVYTGIVIDARGLALQTALFPRIMNEQAEPVYEPTLVDAEIAARRGYIAYASTLSDAQTTSRVGEHPLVVRAHRVATEHRVDLVVRQADAMQLQQHGDTQRLLRQCRVLILR